MLARAFCHAIGWTGPDGGIRAMMARLTMLAMHRDGIFTLPPLRRAPRRLRGPERGPETDPPQAPMPETLDAVRPIRLVRVTGAGPEASRVWNGFVARWHYLGYTPLVGAAPCKARRIVSAMLDNGGPALRAAASPDTVRSRPETGSANGASVSRSFEGGNPGVATASKAPDPAASTACPTAPASRQGQRRGVPPPGPRVRLEAAPAAGGSLPSETPRCGAQAPSGRAMR